MKHKLLIITVLMLSYCTTPKYYYFKLGWAVKNRTSIDMDSLKQTAQQVQERFDAADLPPTTVGITGNQIIAKIQIPPNKDFDPSLPRHVLDPHNLGFWNTYHLKDIEIRQWYLTFPPIKGFMSITDSLLRFDSFGPTVLGICKHKSYRESIIKTLEATKNYPPNLKLIWSTNQSKNKWDSKHEYHLHTINTNGRNNAFLENKHLKKAKKNRHLYNNNEYIIELKFDNEGTKIWKDVTQKAVKENRCIAIVHNDQLLMAPSVQSEITTGEVQITGNFSKEEAITMVKALRKKRLLYPLELVEEGIDSTLTF